MVILDTNIIIDHLRQTSRHSALIKLVKNNPQETFAISMITVQELYEGRSTRDVKKVNDLISTLAPLKIFPYTYEIAKKAGEIARDLSKPIELADSAIAATALHHHCPLVTLNKKDFQDIKGLELL